MPSNVEVPKVDPTKEVVEAFTDSIVPAFSDAIGTQFKRGILPTTEVVLKEADNHKTLYKNIGDPNSLVSSIIDIDTTKEIGGRTKVRGFASTLSFSFSNSSLLDILRGRAVYNAEFGRSYNYEYAAGKNAPDEQFDDVLSTVAVVKEFKDDNASQKNLVLESIIHNVLLVNPNSTTQLWATMNGRNTEGVFEFVMAMKGVKQVDGQTVVGAYKKRFIPQDSNGNIVYKSIEDGALSSQPMPDKWTINMSDTELKNRQEAHAIIARLARYMPLAFTQEQVSKMVGNALAGKVMTAGVWDPLTIPYMRTESAKTYSAKERNEKRGIALPKT